MKVDAQKEAELRARLNEHWSFRLSREESLGLLDNLEQLRKEREHLQPVPEDEPRRDWAYTGDYICRECGKEFAVLNPTGEDPNFCPFCGATNFTNRPASEQT